MLKYFWGAPSIDYIAYVSSLPWDQEPLTEDEWRRLYARPSDADEQEAPAACKHEWKATEGIYRLYEDCIHCNAKREEVESV